MGNLMGGTVSNPLGSQTVPPIKFPILEEPVLPDDTSICIFSMALPWRAEGKRHYVHFTHGLFELTTDPSGMLDSEESVAAMAIPKKQPFSERVQEFKKAKIGKLNTKESKRALLQRMGKK
jgi:hypothetical protein